MAIPCFKQKRFWQAYSNFLFAPSEENPGLSNLADALTLKLNQDRPLRVLCLGVGIGVFEYPILAALNSRLAFPIEVHGIDLAAETLPIAGAVLDNLHQERFSSASKFAEFVGQSWTGQTNIHRAMRCLDLDGRGSQLEIEIHSPKLDTPPWERDFPSLFYEKIQDITPNEGFDIITACNCLSHMHWWRPALCNALELLREGGLLLYSRVDGDVNYLDWDQQPDRWLLEERRGRSGGTLVHEMMRRFYYGIAPLRSELLMKAQSRAINPWEMMDLIERLPIVDLDTHRQYEYFTRNMMSPKDVYDIMDTCGISPFRRAKDVLENSQHRGKYNYASETAKLYSEFAMREPEITRNRIRWHCYQMPSRDILHKSALFRRFATRLSNKINDVASDKSGAAEYELLEGSIVAHNSFKSPTVRLEHFSDFARDLLLSGALRQTTSFGVVGPRLARQEALRTAICFLNPLYPTHSLTDLISNICLRQIRDFSNAGALLKNVLPAFNIPVVFSYVKKDCKRSEDSSIDMQLLRYRSFLEISFTITLPANFRDEIIGSQEFLESEQIIRSIVDTYFEEQNKKKLLDPEIRSRPSFVLEVPTIPVAQLDEFKSLANKISACFVNYNFSSAFESLTRSWQNSDFFGGDTGTDWANVFSEDMTEALFWTCLIPNWKKSVIFPATYADPKSQGVKADDFLILFYDEELSTEDLRHEYRKVTLMFDRLNMRRLATSGEAFGLSEQVTSQSHELSKQTGFLSSTCLRKVSALFEINGQPRTNNRKNPFDWPESVGKITVSDQIMDQVANWLICPMPKIFDSLKDNLTLWAGSRGTFGQLGAKVQSLQDLVNVAKDLAINSRLAVALQGRPASSLTGVQEMEKSRQEALLSLPNVGIICNYDCKLINPMHAPDRDAHEQVLVLIIRVLAAAISNAIEHTPEPGKQITLLMKRAGDEVLFEVRNPLMRSNGKPVTSSGTVGVIRSCLQLLDRDTTDPECHPDVLENSDGVEERIWVTRFALHNPVQLKETAIKWLSNEDESQV